MDRKSLIGLLLIGAVLFAWMLYMRPSKEAIENNQQDYQTAQQNNSDTSINDTNTVQKAKTDSAQPVNKSKNDSIAAAGLKTQLGVFASSKKGELREFSISNNKVKLVIANKGGRIKDIYILGEKSYDAYIKKTKDTLNLLIGNKSTYGLAFQHNGQIIRTDSLFWDVAIHNDTLIEMRLYADTTLGKYIAFRYALAPNSYLGTYKVLFVKMDDVLDKRQPPLAFNFKLSTPPQERDLEQERNRNSIYYRETGGDVNSIGGGGDGQKKIDSEIQWISFKQKFFCWAIIAKDDFEVLPMNASYEQGKDTTVAIQFNANLFIPYRHGGEEVFAMRMYMGPNHYQTLKKIGIELDDQVNLGYLGIFGFVNKWLIIPLFNLFDDMHLGYGLIILLLTLIIKLLLSPITYKTYISSAKMRLLKPDIDKIGEKFPNSEDALKKQQAVMQLYRKAGVSPLAGCIPALLQMPILLAMFSFFPIAYELRQESFLWAVDLSTYDSIAHLPFTIPFYGNHVSLFTLLMTATTILYTRFNSSSMGASGASAKQMQIMMYVMPIIFLGVLNSYSAALSYYYFLSNVVSILLTLTIKYFFVDDKKLHAKIEANKKKPKKKSKFQQRLADMQRMREQQVKQRRR